MKPYRMICLCAALCLLAGEAQAQMGGMGGMGGGGRSRGMGSGGGSTQGGADCRPAPEANSAMQVNFRLSQLQDALHLRAEQMATWQSFAAKVRALSEDVAREQGRSMDLRPGADSGPLPGLKHVSRAVEAARGRMIALEEIEATSTALYKTFTPEQKTLADARVPEIVAPRPLAPVGSVN